MKGKGGRKGRGADKDKWRDNDFALLEKLQMLLLLTLPVASSSMSVLDIQTPGGDFSDS